MLLFSLLICLICLPNLIFTSQCGESTIPFSLETLPTGQVVLGCARPTCFGWDSTGEPLATTANFYRIDQHPDGFLRNDPTFIPPFDREDPKVYSRQLSTCESAFQSLECASDDQWVGGIVPLLNASDSPTAYQCCTFEGLKKSTDRGIAVVGAGQVVVGGEVYKDGKQYAFDYIGNVEKKYDGSSVYYEVNIRRMPCLSAHNFDESIEEVRDSMEKIREVNGLPAKVFQSPTVVAAPAPIAAAQPIDAQIAVAQAAQAPLQLTPPQNYNTLQLFTFTESTIYCFSGDSQVRVMDFGLKRMDELDINDWVESVGDNGEVEFVPISSWIHREPETVAEFREIIMADGNRLKITNRHYIYRISCDDNSTEIQKNPEFAESVKVNDCLYKFNEETEEIEKVRVTNITSIVSRGIYSPMTSSGTILVNDIHTSCYSEVNNQNIQNSVLSVFKKLAKLRGLSTIVNILDLIIPMK